jgi:hypothetical protein
MEEPECIPEQLMARNTCMNNIHCALSYSGRVNLSYERMEQI